MVVEYSVFRNRQSSLAYGADVVMAMAAIGLNTDLVKLVKSGAKPLLMGCLLYTSRCV